MIGLLYLRWLAHALRVQERGLREELAGVTYMLEANAEHQRRVSAQLTMAQTERRWRRLAR